MPEISRFYGIVIRMFFDDHEPAHFHARSGGQKARIAIETGELISGELPPGARRRVRRWTRLHRQELLAGWSNAQNGEAPRRIEPLP